MRATDVCLQTLALASQSCSQLTVSTPTATVQNGTISGLHSGTHLQDFFLGIPYAQPPIHDLRFRNPQSLNVTFDRTFEAIEYSPSCVGYGGDQIGYPVAEDCLTLNVIRPCGYEGQLLPVAVWIHGGDFLGGSRDKRYNLSWIVENGVQTGKPFIGVLINYRLDAWGFISSQEVSGSGNANLGLKDQRLALHWVQENIEAFGGDRNSVTIWGESAGAQSVGFHITAYNGRDDELFRSAIMESGNPVNYNSFQTTEIYQPAYDKLVRQTNCDRSADTLDCLRSIPFETLNNLLNGTGTYWQPVVDGDFIARWTSIQLEEGAFVRVPVIAGATTDEGTLWSKKGIDTSAEFKEYATSNTTLAYLPTQFGDDLLKAYPNKSAYWCPSVSEVPVDAIFPKDSGAQYRRNAAYETDFAIVALRRGTCETWARWSVPAYCYRFNTQPAGIPYWMGVPHFSEVAFVFDNTDGLGYDKEHESVNPFANKPVAYKHLARKMSRTWASFIHDGYPNVEEAVWPKYNLEHPQNLVWDANQTQLVYLEPDTFRADGIRFVLDHSLNYHR